MEKLKQLFKKKNFNRCIALKTELGYKTERHDIVTSKDALDWLKKSQNNSVEFIHSLWSDKPIFTELNINNL